MKKSSYAIFRNARFYGTFASVPWYMRYAITGIVVGCFVLLWYGSSYRLLSTMSAASHAALDKAVQDQEKLVSAQQAMPTLHDSVMQLQEQLAKKNATLQAVALDARAILALIKQHNVTLQLYSPHDPEVTQQGQIKQSIRIDVLGPYDALVAWMNDLAALSPALQFSNVHWEKQLENLLVSLHVFWYEMREHESEKDADAPKL